MKKGIYSHRTNFGMDLFMRSIDLDLCKNTAGAILVWGKNGGKSHFLCLFCVLIRSSKLQFLFLSGSNISWEPLKIIVNGLTDKNYTNHFFDCLITHARSPSQKTFPQTNMAPGCC